MANAYLTTKTLEMVAVALSEEYGVKIVCNGRRAEMGFTTTGKPVITIPTVEIGDPAYQVLIRGYVDHEVGHIRYTDRDRIDHELAKHASCIGGLKSLAMIFEDIAVERSMGLCFFGCKSNLRKFVIYLKGNLAEKPIDGLVYAKKIRDGLVRATDTPQTLWTAITEYVFYMARTKMTPELAGLSQDYAKALDILLPGLTTVLAPMLSRTAETVRDTKTAFNSALSLMKVIVLYLDHEWHWVDGDEVPDDVRRQMAWILRSGGNETMLVDIGQKSRECINDIIMRNLEDVPEPEQINHHEYGDETWKARIRRLSPSEQREALQASAMMDAQMQALLQSFILNRTGSAKHGKINTNALSRLFTANDDIFVRKIRRRNINTEIVVAVDMSGSMGQNRKDVMASKALYALGYSLMQVRGLQFVIVGFFDNEVVDIIRKGARLTPMIGITPNGGTLCGVALTHAMQRFSSTSDSRKIVMMLTDGDANDHDGFDDAIRRARKSGIELLGIGIMDTHILNFLAPEECCVIDELRQLAPAMLTMLRNTLCEETR